MTMYIFNQFSSPFDISTLEPRHRVLITRAHTMFTYRKYQLVIDVHQKHYIRESPQNEGVHVVYNTLLSQIQDPKSHSILWMLRQKVYNVIL